MSSTIGRFWTAESSSRISRFEVISAVAILATVVFGTFFPPESYFAPQDFTVEGTMRDAGFPFGRYAVLTTIIWLAWVGIRNQKLMIRALRRSWLAIVFVVWMICTSSFTLDFVGGFNRGIRTLVMVMIASYLVERFTMRQLLRLLVLASTVLLLASIFAAIAIPQYGLTHLVGYDGAWRGATTHKNTLGASMTNLLIELYFAYRLRSVSQKFALILLVLGLPVLLLAKSATAIIMLVASVCIYALFGTVTRISSINAKYISLCVVAVFAALLVILEQSFGDVTQLAGRDATLTGRTDVWNIVWELIQENPIWGYGNNFWATDSAMRDYIWMRLGWAAPHAHNTYLDIWFQTGLPGLALFSVVLVLALFQTARLLFSKQSTVHLIWPIFIFSMLLRGFTETQFVEPASGAWFWLVLSMASMSKRTSLNKSRGSVRAAFPRSRIQAVSIYRQSLHPEK